MRFPVDIIDEIVGGERVKAVSMRDLHSFLGVKTKFSTWIVNRINRWGYREHVHYSIHICFPQEERKRRPRKEYYFTLKTAMKIVMVERSTKGEEAREYFSSLLNEG